MNISDQCLQQFRQGRSALYQQGLNLARKGGNIRFRCQINREQNLKLSLSQNLALSKDQHGHKRCTLVHASSESSDYSGIVTDAANWTAEVLPQSQKEAVNSAFASIKKFAKASAQLGRARNPPVGTIKLRGWVSVDVPLPDDSPQSEAELAKQFYDKLKGKCSVLVSSKEAKAALERMGVTCQVISPVTVNKSFNVPVLVMQPSLIQIKLVDFLVKNKKISGILVSPVWTTDANGQPVPPALKAVPELFCFFITQTRGFVARKFFYLYLQTGGKVRRQKEPVETDLYYRIFVEGEEGKQLATVKKRPDIDGIKFFMEQWTMTNAPINVGLRNIKSVFDKVRGKF